MSLALILAGELQIRPSSRRKSRPARASVSRPVYGWQRSRSGDHAGLRNGVGDACDLEDALVGDLRDGEAVRRAVRGCARVFHVAADYRFWARDARELYRSNVDGTIHVMDACLGEGVERVVYTSTVGTIGPFTVAISYGDGTSGGDPWPIVA